MTVITTYLHNKSIEGHHPGDLPLASTLGLFLPLSAPMPERLLFLAIARPPHMGLAASALAAGASEKRSLLESPKLAWRAGSSPAPGVTPGADPGGGFGSRGASR